MENKNYFKSAHYKIPDTIKPGEDKVRVEWFYDKLKREDIAIDEKTNKYAIFPGCSCTANFDVDDEKIVAYYKDSSGKSFSGKIGKNVKVFLNDGKPLWIKNEKGVVSQNTSGKKYILLTFEGIVQS